MNEQSYSNRIKKILKIRKATLILPVLSGMLVVYYYSPFSLYFFWHPVLGFLVRLFYFPFYIFSEDVTYKIYMLEAGMVAVPNPITTFIAICVSLALMYLITRATLFMGSHLNLRLKIVAPIISIFILLSFGVYFTKIDQRKCELKKEMHPWRQNKVVHHGMIDIDFGSLFGSPYVGDMSDDEFNSLNRKLGLFYKLNKLKYIKEGSRSIKVAVEENKEIRIACKLESYVQIKRANPAPLPIFRGRNTVAIRICDAKRYNYETVEECERKINEEIVLKDKSVEISQDGHLITKNIIETRQFSDDLTPKPVRYEDDLLSIEYNSNMYTFLRTKLYEKKEGHPYASYELRNVIDGSMLVRGNVYMHSQSSSVNSHYELVMSNKEHNERTNYQNLDEAFAERIKNTQYEKMEIGNYKYVKEVSPMYTQYVTRIGKHEVSFSIDDDGKDFDVRELEDMLLAIVFKL